MKSTSLALASVIYTLVLAVGSTRAEPLKCEGSAYPRGLLELQKGTSVQVPKVVNNRDQKVTIHESTSQSYVPLCFDGDSDKPDPIKFSVNWYAFDRLKQGSFPTFTLFCTASWGDEAPVGTEYPTYVKALDDGHTKIACDRQDRSAFLTLPEYYTLEVVDDKSISLPRVGPYGTETGDKRDPRGFLWPSKGKLEDSYFTVYQYPSAEGWRGLYPISRRVCKFVGKGPELQELPSIIVDKDAVKVVIGDRPAGVQVQCTDKPTVSCPKGIDAKFALTVAGKARIRPLRNDTMDKPVDVWGQDLSVGFQLPCGDPVDVLVDMVDKDATMPGLGPQARWDNKIKVSRRVLCTYSGFNPLNKAHIHFGEGSAEANHDLAITEYWECRDLAQSNKT